MSKQLRLYRNTVIIELDAVTENWYKKLSDNPNYKHWLSIISYLRRRGFKVNENPSYKKHYACLSKNHKIGYKNDIALLTELSGRRIEVEFGNIQNLWTGVAQSFWNDPSDDRYTKLTYLQELSVKNEILKLIDFLNKKFNPEFSNDNIKLKPVEFIIDKLRINKHIHGEVNKLEDIKDSIKEDSYDYKHNSWDKNKKRIICGERKYFYDYNKRLSSGIVWHNINNMWWVIINDVLRNIASHNLFDFDSSLPRRLDIGEKRRKAKLESILKKQEEAKNYEQCIKIRDYMNKSFPEPELV